MTMPVRCAVVKWAVASAAGGRRRGAHRLRFERLDRVQDPGADRGTCACPATALPHRPRHQRNADHAGPADPCAVNLAAPEIVKAVSELPRDPRSNQAWNPEPLAGNYNECAQLSAVIVKANTNSENPNTRAVLFHLGKFIPTGVPDTYGFNGIDDIGDHRRHRRADVLGRRAGAGQRGEVPLERQRCRTDRQHARLSSREISFRVVGAAQFTTGNDISRPMRLFRGQSGCRWTRLQWRRVRRPTRARSRHLQRLRPRRRRPLRVRAAALVRRPARPGTRGVASTTNCSPAPPNSAASTNNAISTSCARHRTTSPSSAGPQYTVAGLTAAAERRMRAVERRAPGHLPGRDVRRPVRRLRRLPDPGGPRRASATGCATPSWRARSRSRRCCSSPPTPRRWPPRASQWRPRSSWCSATAPPRSYPGRRTAPGVPAASRGAAAPARRAPGRRQPRCRGRTTRRPRLLPLPRVQGRRSARTTTCCWSRACGSASGPG